MPATYSIKRNSLSSKWGVWTTETESGSPIEKLVAELKTQEDAESYSERIQAGESHDVIVASLSGRKPKQEGGGLFGRLFKRGSAEPIQAPVSNPVIEIETAQPAAASPEVTQAASALDSVNDTVQSPGPATEEPSRFQPVEQPESTRQAPPAPQRVQAAAPIEAPQVNKEDTEPVAKESSNEHSPVGDIRMQPETMLTPQTGLEESSGKAAQPVAPISTSTAPAESQPVTPAEPPVQKQTAIEAHQQPVSQPQSPAQVQSGGGSRNDGLLVDWTFTPPPDVTPAELEASGQQVPETATQPPANGTSVRATESDSGRMMVEICVNKALKDMSTGDPRVSDKKYNSIASKEYTEVNKAFTTGSSPEYLREELTHLAAVCLAWAEAIEKRQNGGAKAA